MLILANIEEKKQATHHSNARPISEYFDQKSSEYEMDDDEDLQPGGIRIKINKNKKILEHIQKFSKDLNPAILQKEGMTLLFYDFNGSKSSLTSRNKEEEVVDMSNPHQVFGNT
jgi:hypothetical protein